MAREWALAGVSEEELAPSPKQEPPKKPLKRWQNFWYHYKWVTLLIAAIVVASGVFIWQMITRDDPDYHIVVVTDEAVNSHQCLFLEYVLEPYGTDVDGDGKVEILVENVFLSSSSVLNQAVVANATKLTGYLTSRDVSLFVLPPSYYEQRIESQIGEGDVFFDTLPLDVPLEKDGMVWNWKGSALQKEMEKQKIAMPADLYFGVRQPLKNASKAELERCEQGKAFLQTLITAMVEEDTLRAQLPEDLQ